MIFGLSKRTRAIADYDFNVEDGWHGVKLDRDANPRWAEKLADKVGGAGREHLVIELQAMQTRVIGADYPGMLAAVWVETGEGGSHQVRPRLAGHGLAR